MKHETYHERLKKLMDELAHFVYKFTRSFPKEELFGITSQLRRSAISIVLNYVEGYARRKDKVHKNFLEISYGSLKETNYLLKFSYFEGYIKEDDYQKAINLSNEIGAMLWKTIQGI